MYLAVFSANAQMLEVRKLQKQLAEARDSTTYLDKLNLIGFMMHMKSADSCLLYGIQAKAIADRLDYPKGKADAICNIATALFLKGAYRQALDLYTKALREYESIPDTIGTVQMLMNSAVVYEVLGDKTNSVRFSRMALSQSRALSSDSIKSMLYANYELLRPKSGPDSADYYLNKAQEIAIRFNYDRALLFVQQLKSDQLIETGETAKARALIEQSLAITRRNQWEYHEIVGLDYYAKYFLKRNEIDSAIACYDSSYALATRNGFVTFKIEILKALADCYRRKNDPAGLARTNAQLVLALEEEKNNNKDFIGDYITYYNTQQEINQLETQARNNRLVIGLLVGFSLLALGTIVMIFIGYKKMRRQARLQTELNKTIVEQNTLLTQSDEFKARLVSMLAHDFRSPLTTTLSLVGLLKDNHVFKPEELVLFYDSLQQEVETILKTFDNILQWVKKQYAGYTATLENVALHPLLDEVTALHHGLVEDKKIAILNRVDQAFVLHTDREIIQFINRNLLHNALKFSPAGGSIWIDALTDAAEVVVSVRDEGRGMTREQLAHLFAFSKTSSSPVDQSAGVALTICKDFITRLGGRIWAESNPGQGTTFFYALPQRVSPDGPSVAIRR
ncbi:hypothetical protein GCM10027299_18190 [Larkinella ripae]